MSTAAKFDYLTSLIVESQRREQFAQRNLAEATTRPDTQAATVRLLGEQTRQQLLIGERCRLKAAA